MKFLTLLLLINIALAFGCGSSSPVVGRWSPSQRYDRSQETWEPAGDGGAFLQFSDDGKFSGFLKGERASGSYTVDTTVTPHHLILNDPKSGKVNVTFRIEENTMTWKTYRDTRAVFPPNLEPLENEPSFELVIFERQQ